MRALHLSWIVIAAFFITTNLLFACCMRTIDWSKMTFFFKAINFLRSMKPRTFAWRTNTAWFLIFSTLFCSLWSSLALQRVWMTAAAACWRWSSFLTFNPLAKDWMVTTAWTVLRNCFLVKMHLHQDWIVDTDFETLLSCSCRFNLKTCLLARNPLVYFWRVKVAELNRTILLRWRNCRTCLWMTVAAPLKTYQHLI